MFMLEAGKSCILDAIGMEDAKDIGNRLGKTIKLKKNEGSRLGLKFESSKL